MFDIRSIFQNGPWFMSETPVSPGPGRDEDPPGTPAGPGDHPWLGSPDWTLVPESADWPDWREDEAFWAGEEDPGDLDEYEDPDNAPPPGLDDAQLAALIAEAREVTAEQARAAQAAARLGHTAVLAALGAVAAGRRGPGMPGSAHTFPGEYASPAAGFASGKPLDVAPGCVVLAEFAEEAAGDDDRYAGASDDELLGVICAWDRVEGYVCARKHAAVAELARRRPAAGAAVDEATGIPEGFDEFAGRELAAVLGNGQVRAEQMLSLAMDLVVNLPGARAAFWSGVISRDKAEIIATATGLCDPGEARAAEALVLGRAGSLTPGGLRAAIARAVMDVAPDKARKRRERAARRARVERWFEDSGNAGLAGRELPPAQVLAADQRITWWARQLRKAGLEGDMDQLRARAMMDIMLGVDSRPAAPGPDGTPGQDVDRRGPHGQEDDGQDSDHRGPHGQGSDGRDADRRGGGHAGGQSGDGDGRGGPDPDGPAGPPFPAPAGPLAGIIPPGFAGRMNVTVPLATVLGLANRPGDLPGIGPIDPALARDLAAAAARSPRTTWCITVTDDQGHAIGHGCARPEPGSHVKRDEPGGPGGPGPPRPPGGAGSTGGPGFSFTPSGQPGPPGGYGTWRLSTGIAGQPLLLVTLDPIATGECDHRFQAAGHDPGVKLRHLTQIRNATCTGPGCRRPAARCDFEHNTAYEAGGRTCLCNGDPKCRFDHRMKQDRRWKAEHLPGGHVRWTAPSGRQYVSEPTRYPI
jgi:Domain of unknown function (DUF222)